MLSETRELITTAEGLRYVQAVKIARDCYADYEGVTDVTPPELEQKYSNMTSKSNILTVCQALPNKEFSGEESCTTFSHKVKQAGADFPPPSAVLKLIA